MNYESQKNYYELLGVRRRATRDEIKKAFYQIARLYHPDTSSNSAVLGEEENQRRLEIFKGITLAYNTLVDQERRARYDRTLPKYNAEIEQTQPAPFRDTHSSSRPDAPAYGLFGTLRREGSIEEPAHRDSGQFSRMSFGSGTAELDEQEQLQRTPARLMIIAIYLSICTLAAGVLVTAIAIWGS